MTLLMQALEGILSERDVLNETKAIRATLNDLSLALKHEGLIDDYATCKAAELILSRVEYNTNKRIVEGP